MRLEATSKRFKERGERVYRRFISLHSALLRRSCSGALPLVYWCSLDRIGRRLSGLPDPLSPFGPWLRTDGGSLHTPALRTLLLGKQLGAWSLDRDTLELLWRRLLSELPGCILEFGAGVSTLVLAKALSMTPLKDRRLLSIEQNAEEQRRVSRELSSLGLDRHADIIHAPLNENSSYSLDGSLLRSTLAGRRLDWILIDGPSGASGCRFDTLPAIQPLCADGARWFMDDGFRTAELDVLERWSLLPGISVDGIFPVGKGLATGTVRPLTGD